MADVLANAVPEVQAHLLLQEEDLLVERLTEEMARRWRDGERPLAEEYLARHPRLCEQPEMALELVYEEIHLRQEHGQEVCAESLLARFPQWRRQVETLLECHQVLRPRLSLPLFPRPGEVLGEFHLLTVLGGGMQSRVFLASQPNLAGRPVVLKLAQRAGREHLSLARLQHSSIVPLHSVHEYADRGLFALCLPYFGGRTLDRLLKAMHDRSAQQRSGRHIWEALRETSAAGPVPIPVEGPCCRFLKRASYVQAVCWIVACLADALHYAHERGLLHLDVKPANVLLAADGQPMLLDFHLARAPLSAGSSPPLWLGGTPGYMAPEHQAALEAVCRRMPLTSSLDAAADIYALGTLLHELLARELPGPDRRLVHSLRRLNPNVSVGLADVVARCLNPEAARRYPSASAVAADLRRHLADLPLQGVVNRSPLERWSKWRRRHRQALPLLLLGIVVVLGIALSLYQVRRQSHRAQDALREGQALLDHQRYGEAVDVLKFGAALIEDLPFTLDLRKQIHGVRREAERGQAIQSLHLLSEGVRPLYSAAVLPDPQSRSVEEQCRTVWQRRHDILRLLQPPVAAELERQVRSDLLDLAILGMQLRVRLSGDGDGESAWRQGLKVLDEAEALFGPSCVLAQERHAYARALGLTEVAQAAKRQAAALAPRSAWEHCAVGLVHYRAGEYSQAAEEMERALEREPNSLWANFYHGSCAFHLGNFDEASSAFSVCLALAPQCAWCYANRGLTYSERGQLDRAERDYNRAVQLDPTLATAFLGRSVVYYRKKEYARSLTDVRQACTLGLNTAAVSYQRALIHLARRERDEALASLQSVLREDPRHEQAKALLADLNREP